MMSISLKVITVDDTPITGEIIYRQVFISNMTLASFEINVQRIAGVSKPIIILDGLFHIEEEALITLAQPAFLVYVARDSIICSFVENVDDGVSRAVMAIQHQLNLNNLN